MYTVSSDNLKPNEITSLFKDAAASNAAFVNGFAAGQSLAQIQAAHPNFSPPALNASERTLHSPQFQKWSFEWQKAFGAETSGSVGYFGHHAIHELWWNLSANAFGFGSLPAGLCSSPPVSRCAVSRKLPPSPLLGPSSASPQCQPSTDTKEKDLDRIETLLYRSSSAPIRAPSLGRAAGALPRDDRDLLVGHGSTFTRPKPAGWLA
jgi:hypothetical protein